MRNSWKSVTTAPEDTAASRRVRFVGVLPMPMNRHPAARAAARSDRESPTMTAERVSVGATRPRRMSA